MDGVLLEWKTRFIESQFLTHSTFGLVDTLTRGVFGSVPADTFSTIP